MRILLVDDHELNRDMLSRRLAKKGYQVDMAVDGAEGLRAASTTSPDLILLDMGLPEMDGWEVARRLKAQDHTRSIPIIALTAHARKEDEERARAAGCDDFDTKPVEIERLLLKIGAVLKPRQTG